MEPDLTALVRATLAGDETAWGALWAAVEPKLYHALRRPRFLGRLSESEDDCRNIVVEVMARLREDRFARLANYVETLRDHPDVPFLAWLAVVAKRLAIDYMRGHETYVDRRHVADASTPGAWRQVVALPSDSRLGGERPPFTGRGTARELLEYAGAVLAPEDRAALDAWLAGATFEEIAAGGDVKEAERRVRAALRRIRRQFRDEGT